MELKFNAKSLERQSVKLESQEKNEMKKIQDVSKHKLVLIIQIIAGFEQEPDGECQDLRWERH